MSIFQFAIEWAKGEIVEATIITTVGFVLLACAAAFYAWGMTTNTKAMVIPVAVVGAIFFSQGLMGIKSNRDHLARFESKTAADRAEFITKEKQRVEGFGTIYRVTYPLATVFIIVGILLTLIPKSFQLQAVGMVLIFLGMSTYVVDFFAKERGDAYYQRLLAAERPSSTQDSQP